MIEPADNSRHQNMSSGAYNKAITFSGSIVSISQRGAMVRLVIDAGDNRWVSLISQSQQRSYNFRQADTVQLSIADDALHLISAE